jgi:5-methylcytosine-specific restriction endonuclease McrA
MTRQPCIECGTPTPGRLCVACGGTGSPVDTRAAYNSTAYHTARAHLLAIATHCHWCGQPPHPGDPLTADHLHPLADGGHPAGPLVAAHRTCNSRRQAA